MDACREPRKRKNLGPFCQEETSDKDTKHVKPLSWLFWWCLPHLVSIRWKLTTNHYPHHCYHSTYVFYDGNCKRGEKSLRMTRRQTSWHSPTDTHVPASLGCCLLGTKGIVHGISNAHYSARFHWNCSVLGWQAGRAIENCVHILSPFHADCCNLGRIQIANLNSTQILFRRRVWHAISRWHSAGYFSPCCFCIHSRRGEILGDDERRYSGGISVKDVPQEFLILRL